MVKLFSLLAIISLTSMSNYAFAQKKKHKKYKMEQSIPAPHSSSINCDTSIWKYVYNRERLTVLEYCKTVTGTIEECSADDDGDQHMLLKLDKGQENLLTKRNYTKKQGYLVIEAVCANKTSLKKVGTTCKGYTNQIQIPTVGKHVKVTGSLVIDSHNGWAEIHPITHMEILP
ncbi:MAG: hypothetical protein ABIW38_05755 [Ferruginibacter sp.]